MQIYNEILISYPPDRQMFKSLKITNAGENVEQPELSYLISVSINWHRCRKTMWHFLVRVKIGPPYNPTIIYPGKHPRYSLYLYLYNLNK